MKMKFVALLILLASGIHAATPLWNGTATGMNAAQVREKFPAAEEPKESNELFGGAKEGLEVNNHVFYGEPFKVGFFFKDDGLVQVTLSQTTIKDYKALSDLSEKIAASLSKDLGDPEREVSDDVTGKRLALSWSKPNQRVSIALVQSGVLAVGADYIFRVNFQKPIE